LKKLVITKSKRSKEQFLKMGLGKLRKAVGMVKHTRKRRISDIKLANKIANKGTRRRNRNQKKKKLRDKIKSKLKEPDRKRSPSPDLGPDPALQELLKDNPAAIAFAEGIKDLEEQQPAKKRKLDPIVPDLEDYEKGIREAKTWSTAQGEATNKWTFKSNSNRLPIKLPSGELQEVNVISKPMRICEREEPKMEDAVISKEEEKPELTPAEKNLAKMQRRAELRLAISDICQMVLASPQTKFSKLKNVERMCKDKDTVIAQLAMISLATVYHDLLPAYTFRIEDSSTRLSKPVFERQKYELLFLHHYKVYLEILFKHAEAIKGRRVMNITRDQKNQSLTAVGCMGKMLIDGRNFNLAKNLIRQNIPLMNHSYPSVRQRSYDAICTILRESTVSASSLEIIRVISGFIERKKYKVQKEVVASLASLNLKKMAVDVMKQEREGERVKKKSRYQKTMEKNLDENLPKKNIHIVTITQTQIVKEVMMIYFFILKMDSESSLLPVVLDGLAKFAPMINLELVLELISLLSDRVGEMTQQSALRSIHAALCCLEGRGQAIEFDCHAFYERLYNCIWDLLNPRICDDLLPLVLRCLDLMLKQKKQVAIGRIGAFAKRVLCTALHLRPDQALALAHCVRGFVSKYPMLDSMISSNCRDSGAVYNHEVQNPDHSNGRFGILWELPGGLVKSHHPYLHAYATDFSAWADLPIKLASMSSIDLLREFSCEDLRLNPGVKTPAPFKKRKGTRKKSILDQEEEEPDFAKAFEVGALLRRNDALRKHKRILQSVVV